MESKLKPCPFCGSEKLKLVKKRVVYKGHKAYVASVYERWNRRVDDDRTNPWIVERGRKK